MRTYRKIIGTWEIGVDFRCWVIGVAFIDGLTDISFCVGPFYIARV